MDIRGRGKLRDQIPDIDELIDMDKLITLERLELLAEVISPEFAVPAESEEFEAITASQAAELSKRKIFTRINGSHPQSNFKRFRRLRT